MILFERPNQQITTGGGGTWGSITGTLADQTDLQEAIDAKADATDLDGITLEWAPPFLFFTKASTTKHVRLIDS